MATAQSRLTSTDTHAYFDRSKHVDRLEVNAYFGRSETTFIKEFHYFMQLIIVFKTFFCLYYRKLKKNIKSALR